MQLRTLIFGVVLAMSLPAIAAEPDTVAKQEIEHLIRHLAGSGCQFNRNGSWYDTSRAVSHLNRKYDYLRARNLAASAEAFIENAASESSASGKPYLVRCSGQPEINSAAWFRAELARLREKSGKER
jgi:hypothetical protein